MQIYKRYLAESNDFSKSILGVFKTDRTDIAIEAMKERIMTHPLIAERGRTLNATDVTRITTDAFGDQKFVFYVELIKKELCDYFSADLCQIGFTLRINEPGQKAAHFHLDKWVGHPSNLINAWISLGSLDMGNTLYSCSAMHTKEILSNFDGNDFDVARLEGLCSEVASPILGDGNQIFLFSNEFLHGSFVNTSHRRISIDFRIAFFDSFDGVRVIGVDYKFMNEVQARNKNVEPTICQVLTYQNNDARHVNLRAQRLRIQEYASANNFVIESEWSEFHGYETFPQLKHLLKTLTVPIIVFSKRCLTKNGAWIDESLLDALDSYKFGIHYALEGVSI